MFLWVACLVESAAFELPFGKRLLEWIADERNRVQAATETTK